MADANFITYCDDFLGHRVYSATAGSNVGHNWLVVDTSSSGTPTYAPVADSGCGEVALTLESTNEVQNLCLAHGDKLTLPAAKLKRYKARVKVSGTLNAAESVAFGVCSARNDAIDSLAVHASFRVIGASTTVLLETDDATTDKDDVSSGVALSSTYKTFEIDFSNLANVRFFIDGQPVATGTVFDMSAVSGNVQPYVQIQKTAATSTGSVTVDYIEVEARR